MTARNGHHEFRAAEVFTILRRSSSSRGLTGLFVCVSVFALASGAFAYSLTDALKVAATRPAVEAARMSLEDARAELERTTTDPFALKPEKTAAEQRLALGEAELKAAHYAAVSEIGVAYTARLQAELENRAARADEALSRRLVEVAEIRLRRGSVTELEVREAEAALGVAVASRRAAAETLTLTRSRLAALLPEGAARLEPISTWTVERPLPDVRTVLAGADGTPALLSLRQAVTTARLNRNLLDPSYSSARDISAAETALETATTGLSETTRSVRADLQTRYAEAAAAQGLYRAQRTTSGAAQSRLTSQQRRFGRGLISDLELRQTEYAATTARLEMMRAKHLYVTTLLELQAAAATPLWPLTPTSDDL